MDEHRAKGKGQASPFLKRWAANGAWAAAWSAAFGLCVGVFGEAVALVSVTVVAAGTAAVWYATGRRDGEAG
jgi:hypothetical protein